MYTTRLTQLLVVALSAISLAHAFVLDVDSWNEFAHGLVRRQSNTSPTTSAPRSTPPPTSTPTPTPTPTSRAPTSTPPVQSSTPPNPPASSSTPPTPTPSSSETVSDPQSTTTPPPSSNTPPPVSTSTIIVTSRASDGSLTSYTSEVVYTPTGSLNTGGNNGGSKSDITPEQRNIIIGTVVGIGGAIIFGVLGFVAWRIWGKKKAAEENDGLMGYGGDYHPEAKSETTGSTTTRTPFQSTLESYHAPTQVNTASNF